MFSTALYRRMGLCPARFRIRHGLPLALALAFGLSFGAAPLAAQSAPAGASPPDSTSTTTAQPALSVSGPETAVVTELQDGLVGILTSPEPMDTVARSAALTQLMQNTFDINAMGTVAVGRDTYRSWTDDPRAAFLTAFARFMDPSHASRFEDARSPDFEVEGSEDARSGRKVVHSRYLRADKEPVSIDYLVRMTPKGWRVLDVYLDGTVSLLALHRAEFTSVLRAKGFEGFIAAMNAKSDELTPG